MTTKDAHLLPTGTILQQRYRIADHIGSGGMGAVYKAEDLRLQSTVALKQTLVETEYLRAAFMREAQLLASLRHPVIPRVSDHFTDEQGQFLVMEYITGEDLGGLMQRRKEPLDVSDVLHWATQILSALEYLHSFEPPIVHRDIKPQNLKLTGANDIVLLDFGLAKGTAAPTANSSDSVFGYTPHYAPIEQINGSGTHARSDLYSLGATLYHLLTGRIPVDATTRASAVINLQAEPLVPAHQINPRVPLPISAILYQAMAQRIDQRPASAKAMRAALEAADLNLLELDETVDLALPLTEDERSAMLLTKAKSTIRLDRARPKPERRPRTALMLGLVGVPLVLAAAGVGAFALRGNPQPTPTVAAVAISVATAQPPSQMTGSLNIAVANFAPVANQPCQVSTEAAIGLSNVVFRTLSDQMRTTVEQLKPNQSQGITIDDIQIWSPEQTGVISGTTENLAAAAEQKARALNADVLLYGSVGCNATPRETQLTPLLYISDRKSQSFEQLQFLGARPFGSPITSAGTPESSAVRSQFSSTLLPLTSRLSQFLYGIDFYYAGKYQEAAQIFQAATGTSGVNDPFLQFIIVLFQGTAAERLNNFQDAQVFYNKALALDPTNVNAQYSLADALYYASRGDCTPSQQAPQGEKENAQGLRDALDRYQKITISGDTTLDTMLRGMMAMGKAQVYGCMTQAGIPDAAGVSDHWADATAQFKQAISYLEQSKAFGKDHLAEAHAGLGQVYLKGPQPTDSTAVAALWQQAGQQFCAASQISGFATRQAEYHHLMAFIHGSFGEYDQAEIERTTAIKDDPSSETRFAALHKQWRSAMTSGAASKPASWTCGAK